MSEQLKELSTNSMLQTMCPSLSTLARVCLTIPVGTASVECSFYLSHVMEIAIESPQTLSNEELEQIVDVWSRKSRRIYV